LRITPGSWAVQLLGDLGNVGCPMPLVWATNAGLAGMGAGVVATVAVVVDFETE